MHRNAWTQMAIMAKHGINKTPISNCGAHTREWEKCIHTIENDDLRLNYNSVQRDFFQTANNLTVPLTYNPSSLFWDQVGSSCERSRYITLKTTVGLRLHWGSSSGLRKQEKYIYIWEHFG